MTSPTEWLKSQRDLAQRDLEEAQKRLKVWTEALALAEKTGKDTKKASLRSSRGEAPPTVPQLAEEILRSHGPLTVSRIVEIFQERGRENSYTTINVALNRHKGKRFKKMKDRKWALMTEVREADKAQETQE
jgi:hypothetical protein